ncbi:MAG TPA: hypothetical protein ENN29_09175, partial [Candidatus Hydrogenedentes bacterium]|nr:hypothetical protein [Candidatus Hydrogenedentota bacterium]
MTMSKSQERKTLLCPEGFTRLKIRGGVAYLRKDVNEKQLRALLAHEGEVLKTSAKARVRRLGHWLIKETTLGAASAFIGRARRRGRGPWMALQFLRGKGVRVPEPLAYIEYGRFGVVTKSAQICQYLSFHYDVETWLSKRIREGAEGETIAAFLEALAKAVNTLCASGAWHADLSGKNIMTRDGTQFYFVDLDAVEMNVPYDDEKRLKNH